METTCRLQNKIMKFHIVCNDLIRNDKVLYLKSREAHTVNSSMSTVCTTPLLLSLVHLNVGYDEGINIQSFHLKEEA